VFTERIPEILLHDILILADFFLHPRREYCTVLWRKSTDEIEKKNVREIFQ
jgi:hypothetical protein